MNIIFVKTADDCEVDEFAKFVQPFQSLGITITNNPATADVVFFKCQCHAKKYDWNVLNVILKRQLPVVIFEFFDHLMDIQCHVDEWFDWRIMKTLMDSQWFNDEWPTFIDRARSNIKLYFRRGINKNLNYPSWVCPFEPTIYSGHVFPEATANELSSRPNDLCFIGTTSPVRAKLLNCLIESGKFKIDWFLIDWSPSQKRIPHNEWLNRHRQAKMFIEACGAGFGSDRPYQLTWIAPMLQQRNFRRMTFPWVHGDHCWNIANHEGNIGDGEVETLRILLNDPERLHAIYLGGIKHMRENFNDHARTVYVLKCMAEAGLT